MFLRKKQPATTPGWKLVAKGVYSSPDTYHIPESCVLDVCTEPGNERIRFTLLHQRVPNFGNLDLTRPGQTTIREIETSNIISLERCKVSGFDFKPGPGSCALTTAVIMENGQCNEAFLDLFRRYRSEWLEGHAVGRFLSGLYNQWGPPIAAWLPSRPRFTSIMRVLFITPCAFLLRWSENRSGWTATAANIAVMCWYIAGTCTAKLAFACLR